MGWGKNNTRMIDRAQNVGEIECQAKGFILYSSNNGDPEKSLEKENDTFRLLQSILFRKITRGVMKGID